MLYDQGQLLSVYAELYVATKNPFYAEVRHNKQSLPVCISLELNVFDECIGRP
jgi:hypothetical protein